MKAEDAAVVDGFSREAVRESFGRYIWKKWVFIALCVLGSFLAGLYLLTIGDYPIGFWESFEIVIDHIVGDIGDKTKDFIVWDRRLPMILMAVLVGTSLMTPSA